MTRDEELTCGAEGRVGLELFWFGDGEEGKRGESCMRFLNRKR